MLSEGSPQALGTYSELMKSGIDFVQAADEEKQQQKQQEKENQLTHSNSLRRSSHESLNANHNSSQLSLNSSTGGDDLANFITGETLQQSSGEMASSGSVSGRVYWCYVRSGAGFFLLTLLILSNLTTQVLFNGNAIVFLPHFVPMLTYLIFDRKRLLSFIVD